MHFPAWLLPTFFGLFLLLGGAFGWFTRIRILVFVLVLMTVLFGGLVTLSSLNPPAAPELTTDDIYISALIATLAVLPATLASIVARLLKTRSSK